MWVAASTAIAADGELRAELFAPVFAQRIEENRARNPGGCVAYISPGPLHIPAAVTLEERIAAASSVVEGKIVRAEQGFYRGMPGTRFALEVTARVKMSGHSATADVLYVFLAKADIATPRGHICSMPIPGATIPAVGDRVTVLASVPAHDEERQFLPIEGRSDLVIHR